MDNVIFQALVENVLQIVSTLVITALGVCGAWITAKIGKRQEFKNLSQAIQEAQSCIENTVRELQQTLVENFKESSADGKLSESEIENLNSALVDKVIQNLSVPSINILNKGGIDITEMIISYGETVIQKMHESK